MMMTCHGSIRVHCTLPTSDGVDGCGGTVRRCVVYSTHLRDTAETQREAQG